MKLKPETAIYLIGAGWYPGGCRARTWPPPRRHLAASVR